MSYKDNPKTKELTEKRYEAIRLLGKYYKEIKREFREESKADLMRTMMVGTLKSPKDERGVTIPTNRLKHYANTSWIAQEITRGLFPDDEDFVHGIGVIALYHDCGQDPYGHDGESALTKASEEFNGGPRLHNIDGAMETLFRRKQRIISVIEKGIIRDIITEEANNRGVQFNELEKRVNIGEEIELAKKIAIELENNKEMMEEAVWTIATGAGNHNGERGAAEITPDFGRTNEEFYSQALKTYHDRAEDKKMQPCSIADAIVKLSDQISSIPFDIIDAKRAKIEDKILEDWAEPISKVLNINLDEARRMLKGTDKELSQMSIALQRKLIDSVIRSSSQEKMDMDLAPLMYGVTDETGKYIVNGLRTYNASEHQGYTSTPRSEQILNNIAIKLTEKLSRLMVNRDGHMFSKELNRLFRVSAQSPMRKKNETIMRKEFQGPEQYRDFYNYVVGLSSEEYEMNKSIVEKQEIRFFKPLITKALMNQKGLRDNTIERSERGSTEYLIESYVLAPEFEGIKRTSKGISDGEVRQMIIRINDYLSIHPVDGISKMNLEVERHEYELKNNRPFKRTVGIEHLTKDEQIAARIAISYLEKLNDEQFLQLALREGVLSTVDKAYMEIPYSVSKPKEQGSRYQTDSQRNAAADYNASTTTTTTISREVNSPEGGRE